MMNLTELQQRLRTLQLWGPGMQLEPFDWLTEAGPDGALAGAEAYRLIDTHWRPARDATGRDWKPVLVVGEDVLVDASPAMFDRLLAVTGYFDRPEAFDDMLVFQFHRFALDFYQGYTVREESRTDQTGGVTIHGTAHKGTGHWATAVPFATHARRDQTGNFKVEAVENGLEPGP
jgi:hypothetical protein